MPISAGTIASIELRCLFGTDLICPASNWVCRPRKGPAEKARPGESKAPRMIDGFRNADSGSAHDAGRGPCRQQFERRNIDSSSIEVAGHGEGLAEPARAGAQQSFVTLPAPRDHFRDTQRRFQRANQDAGSMPHFAAYEVQTPMQAVGQIYVCTSGRPIQRCVARCRSAETVRRRLPAIVGLGLHDHAAHAIDAERHSDQCARDARRRLCEIDAGPLQPPTPGGGRPSPQYCSA